MKKKALNYKIANKRLSVLSVLFVILFHTAAAQENTGGENTGGTVFSVKGGLSVLQTEIFRDFADIVQFDNQPGSYAGLEISRFVMPALEAGAGFSWSSLKGHAATADLSVLGIPISVDDPLGAAMDYNIRLYGPDVFVSYHFGRNLHSPGSLDFFVKAGAGIQFYELELLFTDSEINALIFGNNYQPDRNSDVVYSFGGGLSYGLSELVRLKLAANINRMQFVLPEVLQNFNGAEGQMSVPGVFLNFSAGIAFKLGKREGSTNKAGFPFAP